TRERSERQQRALAVASERLPQLAPETIRLILARGPEGVLEPYQVFRLAEAAATRGRSALAADEAEELQALREDLLRAMRPTERQRVKEYEEARLQRTTLPFEDRDVLELFAHAGLALSPQARGRLQVLSGKAIAAGLTVPAAELPSPGP